MTESTNTQQKKLLIFGVSGFVGPYLAREFYSNGYSIIGCDINSSDLLLEYVEFRQSNLLDSSNVEKTILDVKPTHIVNLAALSNVGQSWKFPQKAIEVNVVGTLNILEAMRKLDTEPKLLLIGSSEEYAQSESPIAEDFEISANNPYGISKVAQERFAQVYREKYGLKVYNVRSFNHTGVGQTPTFVIPSWCKQVSDISNSCKPGVIKVGNLDLYRDFSDVRDIVHAYRLVIESDDCEEVYNIGSGIALTLHDLLNDILTLSEQPITAEKDKSILRGMEYKFICCDNTKIKQRLGWMPQYQIHSTIREMFDSFSKEVRENGSADDGQKRENICCRS